METPGQVRRALQRMRDAGAAGSAALLCAGRFHLGCGPFRLTFTYVAPVLL
eukprot:COSAG01_NODE_2377_length_7801_cov_4.201117_13_plen_51_part_00